VHAHTNSLVVLKWRPSHVVWSPIVSIMYLVHDVIVCVYLMVPNNVKIWPLGHRNLTPIVHNIMAPSSSQLTPILTLIAMIYLINHQTTNNGLVPYYTSLRSSVSTSSSSIINQLSSCVIPMYCLPNVLYSPIQLINYCIPCFPFLASYYY
jgi:hypothetical protein